jgi:FkbM family methyltransferase
MRAKRFYEDLQIFRLTKNWPHLLQAKLSRKNWRCIELRSGQDIASPIDGHLNFLFHEIWIDKAYGNVPKGTVIDLGANIGVFSIYAALKGATVYAYEPGPSSDYLEQNIKPFPNIHFTRKAVTGDGRKCYLNIEKDSIFHSLSDTGLRVESVTLDSILDRMPVCDLLKFDVEGSEWEILSNCKQLSKIRRIVGEFEDHGQDLSDLLTQAGFSVTIKGQMIYAK